MPTLRTLSLGRRGSTRTCVQCAGLQSVRSQVTLAERSAPARRTLRSGRGPRRRRLRRLSAPVLSRRLLLGLRGVLLGLVGALGGLVDARLGGAGRGGRGGWPCRGQAAAADDCLGGADVGEEARGVGRGAEEERQP